MADDFASTPGTPVVIYKDSMSVSLHTRSLVTGHFRLQWGQWTTLFTVKSRIQALEFAEHGPVNPRSLPSLEKEGVN
jgi:hypothetical protein